MKCLLLENIHHLAEQTLNSYGLKVERTPTLPSTKELSQTQCPTVLGSRSTTRITKDSLTALSPSLRVIGAFCVGADQIDLDSATTLGIPVFNSPYGNTRSVAELALSHIITLSRQSYKFNHDMHQQKWNKTASGSREVRGKTLGIVGYGHIGSQVSVLAESLGMNTLYFDIIDTLALGNARPVKTLKELLTVADFVTLHVPQTPETINLIQAKELNWMKPTAFLINTSRGKVVHIGDLKTALKQGKLAGAALDVFPQEPPKNQSSFVCELQGMRQVVLTPHIGGSTEEAQQNIARQVSSSITKYLFHGISEGSLNFPQLNPPPLNPISKTQRLVNVHQNVPGVLANINGLMSQFKINIQRQYLATYKNIGYLIIDIQSQKTDKLCQAIDHLNTSIRSYVLPLNLKPKP